MTVSTELSLFTLEQLDERIREREAAAALLPPGKIRQATFIEITRLRAEAALRRSEGGEPQTSRDSRPSHEAAKGPLGKALPMWRD